MAKFGVLKSKILQTITEAYAKGDKDKIKEILTLITKNSDFKSMYMFYEEIENKYFENKEDAKLYLDEVRSLLIDKSFLIEKFCKTLDSKIGNVIITENELYSNLDTLTERRKLKNVDKHIEAKNKLIEHLTTKKTSPELTEGVFSENETLLHTVLTNNFNVLYGNTLNEEEKKQLTDILSITDDDLQKNFQTLKEEAKVKTNAMLMTESNLDVKNKLTEVLDEINRMTVTRFNYYKLTELKNGL
jgi:succinate dehydrogenase flavin-adding protein (antitoxin of CptAB toxin-antitoxin module)